MSATVAPVPVRAPRKPAPRPDAPVAPSRPVLAVTDGREEALPAMRAAAVLAAQLGAPVQAVAILEPLPEGEAGAPAEALFETLELARAAATHEAMHRQIGAVTRGSPEGEWPAQVALGRPSITVATMAGERHAELVIIPGGASRPGDRTGGTEAALDVVRAGPAPVLTVGPEADGTLRRAVVAMDFAPAALRAASLACRLLAPGGILSLVHVKPRVEPGQPEWDAWDAARDRRVAELFQRLVVALRGTAGAEEEDGRRDVTIGTATLVGDPVEELIDYAARVGADLVAVGTHGGGFVEQRFLGSVAADLVRRAGAELLECSVLVCPEPSAEERTRAERAVALGSLAAQLSTAEALDPSEWRLALDGFWRRNAGRRVTLEIDDPALGARAASRGFALLSAAYDQNDRRVDLALGDPTDRRRHLTRSVTHVESIAVLTAPDGREAALRVTHGRGQTLLTFL